MKFLLLLLPSTLLFGNIEFSSDHMDYHDKEMSLEGHVHFSSPFGTISSSRGHIIKKSPLPTAEILSAKLFGNVEVTLSKNIFITCDEVMLDMEKHTATITTHKNRATFLDIEKKLQVLINSGTFTWDIKENTYCIQSIEATGGAELVYKGLKIITDNASYNLFADATSINDGIWQLSPRGSDSFCAGFFQNNALQAKSIKFNARENQ